MGDFAGAISAGYGFADPGLTFGAAMHAGQTLPAAQVRIPLAMMTRHGLVAGATGTGKTKTLQVLAEQLTEAGVPVFISDIKGDISGLAAAAEITDKLSARAIAVGWPGYAPKTFPVEFLTLDRDGVGVRLRASVSSFGPILLAKVLDLSETQQSVLAMAFKYADDKRLPLVNLDDLRALLNHLNSDAGKTEMIEYGGVATATVGVIVRKIVELEQQEADAFFGAPEFDVNDFLRTTPQGAGVISVLELADMQDRPALFSTFLMWLLASLYEALPEIGDIEKPKLVFFFDEAHLLFRDASKAFMAQVELVARLIRSKGVGVFFVTHAPADVPGSVLGQLGNRVQHALRAFTPDDLEIVRATAETFPTTEFYDVATELTQLGIGEALVTALDPRGVPMPTVRTMMRPPASLMARVDPAVFAAVAGASLIVGRYADDLDPVSAREMLSRRIEAASRPETELMEGVRVPDDGGPMRPTRAPERGARQDADGGSRSAEGPIGGLLRSIFGVLSGRSPRR